MPSPSLRRLLRGLPFKQRLVHVLRRTGLLAAADSVRFRWIRRRSRIARDRFVAAHPGVALPPDDLAYDAYGSLDWDFYWGFGRIVAEFLATQIRPIADGGRVLEWGCGPARLVRHLPEVLGTTWRVHGCDANADTIRWCATHLPSIQFAANGSAPPLPYADGDFDCVYAVSVFTHLSGELHRPWADELHRVLKPGGTLICTLNGAAASPLLLPAERARFDAGRLVVRGAVTEGTRCFLAYHPSTFVTGDLLRRFDVVQHVPAPNPFGERQDVWIARKRRCPA